MGRKWSACDPMDGDDVDRTVDYFLVVDNSEPDPDKNLRLIINEALKALRGPATPIGNTGTVSLDPALGDVFATTPSGDMTINAASGLLGSRVSLVVTTTGTTPRTLTFGTNFKSTGTLVTGILSGKVFTVNFVGDGTNLNETSRTVAM